MGWLLTIWLAMPLVDNDVKFQMWFSRESYCNFARKKFLENPIHHTSVDGATGTAEVVKYECRKLTEGESHLAPDHVGNR